MRINKLNEIWLKPLRLYNSLMEIMLYRLLNIKNICDNNQVVRVVYQGCRTTFRIN
jgi:hypothetical protein